MTEKPIDATDTDKNLEANKGGESEGTISKTEGEGENASPEELAKLKDENQRLNAEISHARNMQGVAERKSKQEKIERLKLEREIRSLQGGEGSELPKAGDEVNANVTQVKIVVKGMVAESILRNPDYQKVLERDPTLKDVLLTNPLALIDEAFDTEDAVNQIKDKLDSRVKTLKASQKMEQGKEDKGKPAEFESGPINPTGAEPIKPGEGEKKPSTGTDAVESSILSKIKVI